MWYKIISWIELTIHLYWKYFIFLSVKEKALPGTKMTIVNNI